MRISNLDNLWGDFLRQEDEPSYVWIGKELPEQLCTQNDSLEMISGLDRTTRYPLSMSPIIDYFRIPRSRSYVCQWFDDHDGDINFLNLLQEKGDIVCFSLKKNFNDFSSIILASYGRLQDDDGFYHDDPSVSNLNLRVYDYESILPNIDPIIQNFLFIDEDVQDVPTRANVVAKSMNIQCDDVLNAFAHWLPALLAFGGAYLVHER